MIDDTRTVLAQEAMAHDREGRTVEAIDVYRRLLAAWPDTPNCWYNLALLYRRQDNYTAALDCYAEALARNITEPEAAHLNRGVIFRDCLQQPGAAERELNAALRLNPDFVPALINLANLHEDFGRSEAAAAQYGRALALTGDAPEILARYANLKIFSDRNDPLIGRLRRSLARPGISAADSASIGFALGRALDACGDFDDAFTAYQAANLNSRASAGAGFRPYEPESMELLVERMIRAFPRSGGPDLGSTTVAPDGPQPIFICGMFRSGSTLAEQMLAGHRQVAAAGELDFIPRTVAQRLHPFPESVSTAATVMREMAGEYAGLLRKLAQGAPFITDKRPDNFLYIGLIKSLFPHAKFIHTTRDPLDNCLSIYFLHLDQSMSYALDLGHIGHYFLQYRRLMAHWKSLFPLDIRDLHYDSLVKDPRTNIAQTLSFLGLDWCDDCLAPRHSGRAIMTASAWQVREPIYTRSSGRARHYATHLRSLREYFQAHGIAESSA